MCEHLHQFLFTLAEMGVVHYQSFGCGENDNALASLPLLLGFWIFDRDAVIIETELLLSFCILLILKCFLLKHQNLRRFLFHL